MQLHELQTHLRRAAKKRVGRGGKRGKTAGRGEKGQGARAGHRIRPAERDLIQRLPKLRGVKHPRLSLPARVITLDDLEKRFKGNELTREALAAQGFLTRPGDPVKVLGSGKLTRVITVKGVPVSAGARESILKAGGRVE
jgi:large subunit ribosomal protein L15